MYCAGIALHGIVAFGWETATLDLTLEFVVADLLQFCEMHFLSHPTTPYSIEYTTPYLTVVTIQYHIVPDTIIERHNIMPHHIIPSHRV